MMLLHLFYCQIPNFLYFVNIVIYIIWIIAQSINHKNGLNCGIDDKIMKLGTNVAHAQTTILEPDPSHISPMVAMATSFHDDSCRCHFDTDYYA